jgi:putative lipoic acid-binding regulatory protein
MREQLSQQIIAAVTEVVEIADDGISHRNSSAGKYFCISVNALLESEHQRRSIYTQLQQLEGVRYIL